jgi:anti-anti-sigma factor
MSPVTSEVVGPWARITLSGEFDLANANSIRTEVAELVENGVSDLSIDLGLVTFFGVDGINALVAAETLVWSVDGRMVLLGVDAFTQRVVGLLGLDDILHIFAPAQPISRLHMGDEATESEESDIGMRERDFTERFYALSQLLLSDTSLSDDLDQLVRAAVVTVPDSDAASMALLAQGTSRTAATSSHVAIEIDVAQYEADEGPCLESATTGQRIRVDVLDADERYEHFAALAIATGVQTSLSVPIGLGDVVVGSLNLYSMTPGAFGIEAEVIADIIAAQAATAIHRSLLYDATRRLTDQIQQHSDRQAEIAHAEGAISVLHDCSIERAHQTLRSAAEEHQESLLWAARRILVELGSSESGH